MRITRENQSILKRIQQDGPCVGSSGRWGKDDTGPEHVQLFLGHLKFGSLFFLNGKIHLNQSSKHQFSGDIRIRSFGKGYNVFFLRNWRWLLSFGVSIGKPTPKLGRTIWVVLYYIHICMLYTTIHPIYAQQWWLKVSSPSDCLKDVDCPWSFWPLDLPNAIWAMKQHDFLRYIYIGDCTAQL